MSIGLEASTVTLTASTCAYQRTFKRYRINQCGGSLKLFSVSWLEIKKHFANEPRRSSWTGLNLALVPRRVTRKVGICSNLFSQRCKLIGLVLVSWWLCSRPNYDGSHIVRSTMRARTSGHDNSVCPSHTNVTTPTSTLKSKGERR